MRVWINMAMPAYQRQNWPEQLAAVQAASASPAARRDPLFVGRRLQGERLREHRLWGIPTANATVELIDTVLMPK